MVMIMMAMINYANIGVVMLLLFASIVGVPHLGEKAKVKLLT
jgi:hypothetical protein